MIKLDIKDRKILHELDINSRQPYKRIAKSVGLSKDSVIYRIDKLKKNGIIRRFHTVINTGKLGFISFRLMLKFKNTSPEKECEIIDFFKKQANVDWIVSVEGDWDINMWILCKKTSEMNSLWKDIIIRYGDFIEKRALAIFTKVTYFNRGYILGTRKKESFLFISEQETAKTDSTDLRILNILAKDARTKTVDIAKQMSSSPKMVAYRIKRMEKEGIIVGYRTLFDSNKLGMGQLYYKMNILTRSLTPERERDFRMFAKNNPNVVYDNEVMGGEDLEIEFQVNSIGEFRSFMKLIRNEFSDIIQSYTILLYSNEHKFFFLPVKESG